MPPLAIAEAIAEHLAAGEVIDAPRIAPPGFINLSLAEHFVQAEINRVIEQGPAFADSALGQGKRVQLEFVSANPTGPLHVGNGRGAAIGDTLASALAAAGYEVEREYYVNDARHPDGRVRGDAVRALPAAARARRSRSRGRLSRRGTWSTWPCRCGTARATASSRTPGEPPPAGVREMGIELIVEQIRGTLGAFGTALRPLVQRAVALRAPPRTARPRRTTPRSRSCARTATWPSARAPSG